MIIDFALFAAALSNDFVKLRLQLQFLSEVKLSIHRSSETFKGKEIETSCMCSESITRRSV